MSAITFLLSTVRADQNLFELIPAGSGFLTLAKSHSIFSQYWENNYSNDREFCYEFFLSSRFSLFPLPLVRRLLLQRRCTCFVIFWNFLAYRLLKPIHVG
jgi:hypothetical protein